MDTQLRLTEWLRRMGYDKNIPESMDHICNPSTLFIWEQILQNAKSKEEVDHARNNIIIKRLKEKPLAKQGEFLYPIKEIEVYKKKQELENKVKILQANVDEKDNKINNISKHNKINYLVIDNLKAKIKQNEEREFLLQTKCKTLQEEIAWAEETFSIVKSLTPVEMEENPNTQDITTTLQKCADKLESLLKEVPTQRKSNICSILKSVRKTAEKQLTYNKYLNKSFNITSTSEKLAIIKQGKPYENKENVKKSLFTFDCDEVKEIEVASLPLPNDSGKKPKRESLGILPDSCFNADEGNFLTCNVSKNLFPNSKPQNYHSGLSALNDSPIDKVSLREMNSEVFFESRSTLFDNQSSSSSINQKVQKYDAENMDKNTVKVLNELMCNHNRYFIWNIFQTMHDSLIADLNNIILENGQNESNSKLNKDDVAKLRFIHVNTEIQTMGYKVNIKKLIDKINNRKEEIFSAMASKRIPSEKIEKQKEKLELILKDIGLDTILSFIKKENNSAPKQESNNELLLTLNKIANTKESIANKLNTIDDHTENIYRVLQSITCTREETISCVRRLNNFFTDFSWAQPLTENICSNEVKAFEKFPLEYNRRFTYTDPNICFRDLCLNSMPVWCDTSPENLYMIATINESPFNPPETILLNLLKNKIKLQSLKSLPNISIGLNLKKYSLKELQSQENYVQFALDKLNSLMYSTPVNKTLNSAAYTKKCMEIWTEMPFKDFISPKRLVHEKNYQFYEKQYETIFKSML